MQQDRLVIEGTQAKIEKTIEFETSYFKEQYQQAFQAVQDIIDQNLSKKKEATEAKKQNIIPFIGKRGSGKTSAMMSFSAFLQGYSKNANNPYEFQRDDEKVNVEFLCLESIDGSLLEDGEDIFKLILAQMYGEFFRNDKKRHGRSWSKEYDYEKSELQQLFDSVYCSACELDKNKNDDDYYGESSILTLKNLSNSLQLAHEFSDLVKRYLAFLDFAKNEDLYETRYSKRETSFLVIIVDDLDLNLNQGYEMLEKLHRYTMVENVIVLLSVDYNQMEILCEKQFYGMIPRFDSELQKRRNYIKRLSRDFLNKVFPGNYRIYMPTFNNTKDIQIRDGQDIVENPKMLLFKMLYQKLGLRLDVEGTKKHFYEQESLRTFVSFYLMLDKMKNLDNISGNSYVFKHNYKVLMADTLNRMADERLGSDYAQLFEKLTENDYLHAARNLYTEVVRLTQQSAVQNEKNTFSQNQERDILRKLGSSITETGYSYGEILRIIYSFGRVNSESKAFIRCFLAYSTLELAKEFREFDGGDIKKKQYLADIMNGSVVGSWANEIMPRVSMANRTVSVGMAKDLDMRELFEFEISGTRAEFLRNGYMISMTSTSMMNFVKQVIKSVVVISMFFDQPSYKVGKIERWHLVNENISNNWKKLRDLNDIEKESDKKIVITGEGYANFNIFGFVTNAFLYKENIRPIIEDVCDILLGANNGGEKKRIIRQFDNEFAEWERKSKGVALPIYSIDVTYNIVKRVYQQERVKAYININRVWNEIVEIYRSIYEKLEINDKQYMERFSRGEVVEYAKIFTECPYIKWIFEDVNAKGKEGEGNFIPDFENQFKQMISRMMRMIAPEGVLLEKRNRVNWGYDD